MLGMLKLKRVSQTWILNEENKKDINQLAQGLIIVKNYTYVYRDILRLNN